MRSKQQQVLPSNGTVKFSRRRWGSDLPFDKQIDHCRIGFSSQFGGKEKIWINRRNTDRCQISLCKIIHICRNQETRLGRDGISKDLPVLRRRSEKPTCTFTNGAKLSPKPLSDDGRRKCVWFHVARGFPLSGFAPHDSETAEWPAHHQEGAGDRFDQDVRIEKDADRIVSHRTGLFLSRPG